MSEWRLGIFPNSQLNYSLILSFCHSVILSFTHSPIHSLKKTSNHSVARFLLRETYIKIQEIF